jgi:hypothetical protein
MVSCRAWPAPRRRASAAIRIPNPVAGANAAPADRGRSACADYGAPCRYSSAENRHTTQTHEQVYVLRDPVTRHWKPLSGSILIEEFCSSPTQPTSLYQRRGGIWSCLDQLGRPSSKLAE